jgi:hypothetical protein
MPDFDPATVIEQIRPAAVDLGKRILLHHETITIAGKPIALVAATGPGLQRLRDRIAQQPGLVDVFRLDRNRGAGQTTAIIDRTRGAGET